MSCEPERVTGYVDDALDPASRAEVEAHLATCAACSEQAAFEKALQARLRLLSDVPHRPELETRVRVALRPRVHVARWLVALAAGLVLLILWGRGAPAFVAWELAQDHARCHVVRSLPIPVGGAAIEGLEGHATAIQAMPRSAAGTSLVAASLCELRSGSLVVHLQYADDERRVSVFIVEGDVHLGRGYAARLQVGGVRLLRAKGEVVGLVGERPEDLDAFEKAVSS